MKWRRFRLFVLRAAISSAAGDDGPPSCDQHEDEKGEPWPGEGDHADGEAVRSLGCVGRPAGLRPAQSSSSPFRAGRGDRASARVKTDTRATPAAWPCCSEEASSPRCGCRASPRRRCATCVGRGPTWSSTEPGLGVGWASSSCATVGSSATGTAGRSSTRHGSGPSASTSGPSTRRSRTTGSRCSLERPRWRPSRPTLCPGATGPPLPTTSTAWPPTAG